MSHVDYNKWQCRPVDFKKTSCHPVDFKKVPCRPVDFKKIPCRLLLRPQKGRVAVSILMVHTPPYRMAGLTTMLALNSHLELHGWQSSLD